ncbi:hypothetical protein FB446DRAFT_713017 [Lentinula raphanica]|nr:hypothetical protein FB446DRAFT_713017 [Lentinula raphanica]
MLSVFLSFYLSASYVCYRYAVAAKSCARTNACLTGRLFNAPNERRSCLQWLRRFAQPVTVTDPVTDGHCDWLRLFVIHNLYFSRFVRRTRKISTRPACTLKNLIMHARFNTGGSTTNVLHCNLVNGTERRNLDRSYSVVRFNKPSLFDSCMYMVAIQVRKRWSAIFPVEGIT